jgi:DNA repair protein RecO (recombination protein O)
MGLTKAEAIVLRQHPLAESDLVVTLFTREVGKIRAVAKSARRSRSRFRGGLEVLSLIRVEFYERESRELVYLSKCDLLESFFDLQSDYGFQVACAYWVEVVDAMWPDREASQKVFRLMLTLLRSRRVGVDTVKLLAYFNYWVLRLAGILPGLEDCRRCGASLVLSGGWLIKSEHRVYCPGCRPKLGIKLSKECAGMARAFSTTLITKTDQEGLFGDDVYWSFNNFLEPLVVKAVDKPLRSIALICELRERKAV